MLQDNENFNLEQDTATEETPSVVESAFDTEKTPEAQVQQPENEENSANSEEIPNENDGQSPFFGGATPYTAEYIPFGYTEKTYRERKSIRKTATQIGIALLCTSGIMYLWQYLYLLIMTVLGYSRLDAVELLQDSGVLEIAQIILSLSAFIIPFTLVAKAARLSISDLIPLGKPKKGTVLPFTLIGIGFCAFANIAISQAGYILEQLGFEYNVSRPDPPTGVLGFMLTVISTAIVPALVEEYGCRGVMFGMLEKYGQGFALITSSVLFGVMHGNFKQMPFAFLVGLILGLIRIKTGSMWVCVLVHGWNNLVSVIFTSFDSFMSTEQQNIAYTIYLVFAMIGAIIGVLLITRRSQEDVYTLEKSECEATERQKNKWFYTSGVIITFIVLECLQSILYFFE